MNQDVKPDVNPDPGWDGRNPGSLTSESNNVDQHRWQRFLLRAINFYQVGREGRLSPCRFTPSCSEYSREAVEVHGAGRGIWLTVRRLLRCRPFGPSGYDPVPELSLAVSPLPDTPPNAPKHRITSPIARHPIGRSH